MAGSPRHFSSSRSSSRLLGTRGRSHEATNGRLRLASPYVTSPCWLRGVQKMKRIARFAHMHQAALFASPHFLAFSYCMRNVFSMLPPPWAGHSPHREGVNIVPVGGIQAGFFFLVGYFVSHDANPPLDGCWRFCWLYILTCPSSRIDAPSLFLHPHARVRHTGLYTTFLFFFLSSSTSAFW